jgi:hypothetical protein
MGVPTATERSETHHRKHPWLMGFGKGLNPSYG